MAKCKVEWSVFAENQAMAIFRHISIDSAKNAEAVFARLRRKLDKIADNPEMCPPDKYKKDNDGTFRSFVISGYSVSYRFKIGLIRVLKMQHGKRKPKYY